MWEHATEIEHGEGLWEFSWANAPRAEKIAMELEGVGLDFEVTQGYAVRDREWTYSATITFLGTPAQAESLFHAIQARPWDHDEVVVTYHDIEGARVTRVLRS